MKPCRALFHLVTWVSNSRRPLGKLTLITMGLLAPCSRAAAIDLNPVLVIGTRPISRYLLEKYYLRHVEVFTSEHGRPPAQGETKAWLQHFIEQQFVITEAASRGYLDRPEVKDTVLRMERHMLMEPGSPLFQTSSTPSLTDYELKELYSKSARVLDGMFAHFTDEASLHDALGEDFLAQSSAEQTRRIREARHRLGALIVDGRLGWPYEPLGEIAQVLDTSATGRWIRRDDPSSGIYLFYIRAVSLRTLEDFARSRSAFAQRLSLIQRRNAQKRFQLAQLTRSRLVINVDTISSVLQLCLALPSGASTMPDVADESLAHALFFSYSDGSKRVSVSIEAYRRWFNDRMVRRIPNSKADLYASIEDYVVEELSLEVARASGADADRQFAEDRKGFAAIQALDLFEREVLAPAISIGDADIEQYYSTHGSEFQRTTGVGGRKLTFGNVKDAGDWIYKHQRPGTYDEMQNVRAISNEEVEISQDHPIADLASSQQGIMMSPPGTVFGPFRTGETWLVFVKEKNIALDMVALPAVKEVIRSKLLRPLLDRREGALAVELASHYSVEDHIDYAFFGLTFDQLKLPWARERAE